MSLWSATEKNSWDRQVKGEIQIMQNDTVQNDTTQSEIIQSDAAQSETNSKELKDLKYTGRMGQTFIYLIKLLRIFVFQSDWIVLPMAAIIAAMVSIAVGGGLFLTMEGTFQGTFALCCVGIWNGFFNSIQSICRERDVIKREHRAGLHITSYVLAHTIYQTMLCALQTAITLSVCHLCGVYYPSKGVITGNFVAELYITVFLITLSSDLLALMISAMVRTTTAAMTVMPFMLIVQLVFAGFFTLPDMLNDVSDLMISKWGVQGLCAVGHYNDLPAVVIWNKMAKAGDKVELGAGYTLKDVMDLVEEQGMKETVQRKLGEASQNVNFDSTIDNVLSAWGMLLIFAFVYDFITVVCLEFIDRDKR